MIKKDKIIVEITNTHLKFFRLCHFKAKNPVISVNINRIDSNNLKDIEKSLKAFLGKAQGQKEVILILPRRLFILKQIRLPSQAKEELKKMISLQLGDQSPYALEDMVFNYEIIDKDSLGYSKVLISVISKDICIKYINIFEKLGIFLKLITLSSHGIVSWVAQQEAKGNNDNEEPILSLTVDCDHTEFCFSQGNNLFLARSISCGLNDLERKGFGELIKQIHLSIKRYQDEAMGPSLEHVNIFAPQQKALTIKEQLEQSIDAEIMCNPLNKNNRFPGEIDRSELSKPDGVSLIAGLGSLFFSQWDNINFVPSEVQKNWRVKHKQKQVFAAGSMGVVFIIMSVCIMSYCLFSKTVQLKNIEEKINDIKPIIQKAKDKKDYLGILHREFNKRIFIPELISEIHRIIPLEISVTTLRLNAQGHFDLHGYSQEGTSVNSFQSLLVKSHLLKKVNLQFAKKKKIKNMDLTEFKISAELCEE